YKRYDNKYIYVVAVVPDVDTGSQVVIFHEGIDACECKYYSMTKQSFCEMVEVDGEWVDKFVRQPQIKITDTHIRNLIDGGQGYCRAFGHERVDERAAAQAKRRVYRNGSRSV
ncbi:MAG: hypothetical protein IJB97_03855, partial [Clostridia bacterium]|nr:hypothetical protein [Clostridia bacterium]